MPRRSAIYWVAILTLSVLAGCGAPDIDSASVERVLSTLSADSMQGRRAFTPAADRTVEFIRNEFEEIGLQPFGDLATHRQALSVRQITVDSGRVVLDGREVSPARTAFAIAGSIRWTDSTDVEILRIDADMNPVAVLGPMITGARGDVLVLMSEAHRQAFDRFRRFLSGHARTVGPDADGSTALVLTNRATPGRFLVEASAATTDQELANVVGVIPGRRPDEIVVFSAHHDHVGIGEPVDGDSIFNGANDNASGTTAVIELARYFAALPRPERTLVFVAFAAEEMGGFGSRYFASQLEPSRIVALLNIEMIGKVAAEGPDRAWITGFEQSDLGAIMDAAVTDTSFAFYADPYPEQQLFYRSDNVPFARVGVPAHSISTTPIDVDPDYHRVSDEVGTLDLDHMTATIRGIANGAAPIISGARTPSRIDPARLR
jgi:hypothetical protein